MDITIIHDEPIGSAKDIAKAVSQSVKKATNELLTKLNRQDVTVNFNLEETLERVVAEYTQKSCEITAKKTAITFAEHIIDVNERDKTKLENAYQVLFYGA